MKTIIDISEHQAPEQINYPLLSKQVSCVIIRTQYGSRRIDKHFQTHHTLFQKEDIPTAAYAWVRGINTRDMEKEAFDFYQRTSRFKPLIWFLDVEEKSMKNMRQGISAYIKKLRSLGARKIGLYIAHHHYRTFNLDTSQADVIWLPHYGKNNGQVTSQPQFSCDLHQYTDKGKLPGYHGFLDLNRVVHVEKLPMIKVSFKHANKRVENKYHKPLHFFDGPRWHHPSGSFLPKEGWILIDQIWVEGAPMYKVKNSKNKIYYITADPKYVEIKSQSVFHHVKSGDTVSALALKYGTTIQQIKVLNQLKDVNKIYIGDKLRMR